MFALPELPYAYGALAPAMSERTLHLHHDKHHRAYVEKVNDLLAKAGTSPASLEETIIGAAKGGEGARTLFNNAAQAWNHGFFWNAMTPRGARPEGDLAHAIDEAFGGLSDLGKRMVEQGVGHFGSGWVWLVADGSGKLDVLATHDAQDMVTDADKIPLLVCDLWEHAYYLDYQNERGKFLAAWFDALANWEFAAGQFSAARRKGQGWRYPAPSAHAHAA